MADTEIVIVGPGEIPLITQLYNDVFRPARDEGFFQRRLRGRYNTLLLVANLEKRPVGFCAGFELKPNTYFNWLVGVSPDCRRMGIASQLIEAQSAWAAEHNYAKVRFECHNKHRVILKFAMAHEYDIVGLRWDADRGDNLVILEKQLSDDVADEAD